MAPKVAVRTVERARTITYATATAPAATVSRIVHSITKRATSGVRSGSIQRCATQPETHR